MARSADKKATVLFVAGLEPMSHGEMGGQLAVASTLFSSPLAERFDLVPISSTMESVPPPPLRVRARAAGRRLWAFGKAMGRAHAALIFAAAGLGVVEKGLMAQIARMAGKGVVLRFSSGELPADCEASVIIRESLRAALRAADFVCAQGPAWAEFFSRFPEARGKVVIIPNPVVLGPPPQRVRAGTSARVIFVGWLERKKGIFDLVEVIDRVRVKRPGVELVMLGGGMDQDEFERVLELRGLRSHVRLTGWVPRSDVRGYLDDADVFVLPSHNEGLPNAMLEAMAAGLPVVVTRVGSVPDVVSNGQEGYVVQPRDVAAMATALEELLGDPARAKAMGTAGRQKVEVQFALDRVWRQYADVLERAVNARSTAQHA